MLECCEEDCWERNKVRDSGNDDGVQGGNGSTEEWPDHSTADHERTRHATLVKMGVMSDVDIPEEDTFSSYNKVSTFLRVCTLLTGFTCP